MSEKNKITAQEIRFKLHKFQNKDLRFKGRKESNKLVKQYRAKVQYMLMWMRLIPINKKTLKGWSMPDMRTISDFANKNTKIKDDDTLNTLKGVKGINGVGK